MLRRPKISTLLSQLASYEAVQAAPTHVDQEGKTALKRKEVKKALSFSSFLLSFSSVVLVDFPLKLYHFRVQKWERSWVCTSQPFKIFLVLSYSSVCLGLWG